MNIWALDDELNQWMNAIGVVLIVGSKWCGKTTTAEQHAKSVLKFQDIDRQEEYQVWLDIRPSKLLEGEKPRLIDEWQMAPILSYDAKEYYHFSEVVDEFCIIR